MNTGITHTLKVFIIFRLQEPSFISSLKGRRDWRRWCWENFTDSPAHKETVLTLFYSSLVLTFFLLSGLTKLSCRHWEWISAQRLCQPRKTPTSDSISGMWQVKYLQNMNIKRKYNLNDLSGQERYRCLSRAYLKGCQATV